MNQTEIEFAVKALVSKPYDPATFPFDLIGIYNSPKVTVTKLKSGQTNAAAAEGDVLWKKHLFFRPVRDGEDVAAAADTLALDPLTAKHKPRFIFTTNGVQVHIRDLKLDDTCNTDFDHLDEKSDFLLPLAGFERRAVVEEHPADIKAAKRLKKLYDAILAANPTWSAGHHTHELNLFMTRVLFCFYAEDTGIFDTPQMFTAKVTQHTKEDGSDVAIFLDRLFRIMNVEDSKRPKTTPAVEQKFPYVNGSLFETTLEIPVFNRTSRRLLLECGELDWTTINPDIFGSMIQTITEPGARSDVGMHYTSMPNIMKLLDPLFLDNLNKEYEKSKDNVRALNALLMRLAGIRVFDPACGSGNFLIIAYKALRRLEMRILNRIGELSTSNPLMLPSVSIHNFFGIDIVDFACETAKLSLWIAEYQMNSEFKERFGAARPPLPLGKITTICNGNSLRLNWFDVCSKEDDTETYICGNPPYQGSVSQTPDQKTDISAIFAPILRAYKDVDYVSCWFVKMADYIASSAKTSGALVATNSICQGEHVAFLWPYIFDLKLRISFACTPFKWTNRAAHNAGVTCVIVGLSMDPSVERRLYTNGYHTTVSNINAYLVPTERNLIVSKRTRPISNLPTLVHGSIPSDGGHLILSSSEAREILNRYPEAKHLIRRFFGTREFLYSIDRYALWITDEDAAFALSIPPIAQRIKRTQRVRMSGGSQARAASDKPHRFAYISHRDAGALVIPEVSSERRNYLQIGHSTPSEITSNKIYAVYNPPRHLLALLSSRLHYIWAATVGGRMEMRLQYSAGLVYNTFPVPSLSDEQKRILSDHSRAIVRARAPGKTLAWLYNPETMPTDLLEAHKENDAYIEECVYGRKFKDDTQRLEHLFALYATMNAREDSPLLMEQTTRSKKGRHVDA